MVRIAGLILPRFSFPIAAKLAYITYYASFVGMAWMLPSPLKEIFFWGGSLRAFEILDNRFSYESFWHGCRREAEKRMRLLNCEVIEGNPVYWTWVIVIFAISHLIFLGLIQGGNVLCTRLFGAPSFAMTLSWEQAAVVLPVAVGIGAGVPLVIWMTGLVRNVSRNAYQFGLRWYESFCRWGRSDLAPAPTTPSLSSASLPLEKIPGVFHAYQPATSQLSLAPSASQSVSNTCQESASFKPRKVL